MVKHLLSCLIVLLGTATLAQEIDPEADAARSLDVLAEARALCDAAPDSTECRLASLRVVAIVANAAAEAGRTRDRGSFIEPIRALLQSGDPQVRTSAAYALAKMAPDSDDTATLLALLRDPISNVRAGAWSAAARSSDPLAKIVARRLPDAPSSDGYNPDGTGFDPAMLGLVVPEGAEFLWLTSDKRRDGELDFLTPAPREAVVADFAAQAGTSPVSLTEIMAARPTETGALTAFLGTQVFGAVQVMTFEDKTGALPLRFVVVFDDLVFGQTGFAVIFADGRSLWPSTSPETPPEADQPLDEAAFDAALLAKSGYKTDADPDESALFMAIVAANGYGAADYLELYPDGAYAEEARALAAAPQLIVDQLSYPETSDVTVRFANLPAGSSAQVEIVAPANSYGFVGSTYVEDALAGDVVVPTHGEMRAGVQIVTAQINPGDGGDSYTLTRDFSVVGAVATLTLDAAEYAPGALITVSFAGMSGDTQDYVSTAAVGAPTSSYMQYVYTKGAREGTATLPAPSEPGTYEVRAFYREDESSLRGSVTFTVAGTVAGAAIVTPTLQPEVPTTPAGPGDTARATLTLDKSEYAPGASITVTYGAMSGSQRDYVATATANAPNGNYLQYAYTNGALAGSAILVAPSQPGTYELRAFFDEDESVLRASVPFTVAGSGAVIAPPPVGEPASEARAKLALDEDSYAPGDVITVTYGGMFGDPYDYVSVSATGAPNTSYVEYIYTKGARDGEAVLHAPTAPGSYEVRAFFKEDETIMRGSVPFTVK